MVEFDFAKIEKKWQKKWEEGKIFCTQGVPSASGKVNENSKKPKYYILEMFPYPSASGLHMGHALNFSIGDVLARFKRMNNFEVLYPMGFDAFGLPAENAAIKAGEHPKPFTENAMKNYVRQMKELGLSYDWTKTLATMSPEYYKWNQYFFLKFLEAGLIYRKKAPVNWCPSCNTVISNEQAQGGICERCKSKIEIKHLDEWYLKTTKYADELLEGIKKLDWPDKIKAMQKNWIGKSHGVEIDFLVEGEKWSIFTTRPDTIFGVTFMVVSAQHERLNELVMEEQKEKVDKFLKSLGSVSEKEIETLEKEGVFTGSYAVNPANGESIPIYAGNFVVANYGSGMVMAVPAHDQRDFEFAKKYGIEIRQVVAPVYGDPHKDAVHRDTITAVVHRKEDNKFLMLKWNKFNWISPVIGGIKNNESIEDAAIREVEEETGYKTKFIKILGEKVESHFYADNKKVWRSRLDQPVLLELVSSKFKEVSCEEKERHKVTWMSAEEILEKGTFADNNIGLLVYLGKNKAYTDKGKLTNSGEFDNLNNIEAKEKITDWLIEKNVARKIVQFKLRDWGFSRQRYWGTPIPIIYCQKCGIVPVPEKDLPVILPDDVKFGEGNPLTTNKEWINVKCPKCGSDGKRETETMDTFFDSSWYFLRYPDNKNDKEPFDKKKIKKWLPVDQYIGGAEHACMHLIYARFFTKVLRDLKFLDFDEPFKALFNQGMLSGPDGDKMSKSKGNVINPDEVSNKYGMDTARYFLLSLAAPDKPRDWSEKGIRGSLRFIKKIFNISENIKFGKSSDDFTSKLNSTIKDVSEFYGSFKYRKATIKLKELFDLLSEQKEVAKKDFGNSLKLLSPICPHISEELWEKLGNKDFISVSEWPRMDEKKIGKKSQSIDLNDKIIENVKSILEKIDTKPDKIYVYVMPFEIGKIDIGKISKILGKKVEVFAVSDSNKYDPVGKSKNAKPGKAGIYLE